MRISYFIYVLFFVLVSCASPAEKALDNFTDFFTELRNNQKTMSNVQRSQYISRYNYLIEELKKYNYNEQQIKQIYGMADRASVWLTGEHSAIKSKKTRDIEISSQTHNDYEDPVYPETITGLEIPSLLQPKSNQILVREGYTTSYNKDTKNPNWVAWHLTSAHTSGEWSRKGILFIEDNEVKGEQQDNEAYRRTSLPVDHGHMCPAGDNKWSAKAMEQSFLLTNICPQNSNLNRGDWNELEERCRGWARHYEEIWIACGPIFYNETYTTIGNKIGVPDAFFKVVLRLGKKPKALGFIYPNEGTNHRMSHYVMTVDEVEEITGIDFFYNLPDEIEEVVEASANINEW